MDIIHDEFNLKNDELKKSLHEVSEKMESKLEDHESRIKKLENRCPTEDSKFKYVLGKCYAFENVKRNFEAAKSRCHALGGRLFEPKNKETHDNVVRMVNEFTSSSPVVWFGLNYNKSTGGLTYLSDGQSAISFWASGQPYKNGHSSSNSCVVTRPSHLKWYNDKRCGSSSDSFTVCEMN